VRDAEASATYCSHCHAPLIRRNGYQVTAYHLRDGQCPHCGTPCKGLWSAAAGHWGERRQPVMPAS